MAFFLKKYIWHIFAIVLWGIYFITYSERFDDENSPIIISFIVWVLMIIALGWKFYEFRKK
ncbi:hypothetical protein [Emticicia sp. SJ17W-69]|uniref:hypothetical protein n=1 Tax=Emticicia sp. SJ17W-69 TaxID=3421657 RepID=UPI003EBFCC5F